MDWKATTYRHSWRRYRHLHVGCRSN